jgi:hypothetical protein
MVAFFYISLFLFALLIVWFVTRRTSQAPTLPTNNPRWMTQSGRALFADEEAAAAFVAAEAERADAEQRAALLARAQSGDVSVLDETQTDAALYRAALDALTAQAESDAAFQALSRYVLQRAEWRVTTALALAVCTRWQAAWRAGQLPWLSAAQLSATIESEYWLLAPEARNSGAGFLLQQQLVAVRRELAAVAQQVSAQ